MVRDAVAALREENDELRERVRQLGEELASSRFSFPWELGLTRTQTLILNHLLTRDTITRRSTNLVLYSDRGGTEPSDHTIVVQISHIRRKLRPIGIEIATVHGSGWRMVDRENVAARFS